MASITDTLSIRATGLGINDLIKKLNADDYQEIVSDHIYGTAREIGSVEEEIRWVMGRVEQVLDPQAPPTRTAFSLDVLIARRYELCQSLEGKLYMARQMLKANEK